MDSRVGGQLDGWLGRWVIGYRRKARWMVVWIS